MKGLKETIIDQKAGKTESGKKICTERLLPVILLLLIYSSCLTAQTKKQDDLTREVTLYNPYKPSLSDAVKKGFFPDMTDTAKVNIRPVYTVRSEPFMPEYIISPIKAATLLPDPLEKLYKSYIKAGFGNHFTPLGEISITNERSKKGAVGFYGRHFSTNGNISLQNHDKVFAGFMDNDAGLFGRKFFRKNVLDASLDFNQKTRHAYGYDTSIVDYDLTRKMTRLGYNNLGARVGLASTVIDSSTLAYDFSLAYNYFYNSRDRFQHKFSIEGLGAKNYKDFYVGSGLTFDYFKQSDSLKADPGFIFALSPFAMKSSSQWTFKLGLQLLIDNSINDVSQLHLYPDVRFGFNVVQSYIKFFTALSGKLERNEPMDVIAVNPFLLSGGPLFRIPNTDHEIIFKAGLQGNNGMEGEYELSASYSLVDDMLLFTNYVDRVLPFGKGNFFIPLADDAEIFNIHGATNARLSDKITVAAKANYYSYTLTNNEYAWGKPGWDAGADLKYNLRDKILAGVGISMMGPRGFLVTDNSALPYGGGHRVIETPVHFNMDIGAEYRYTRILSIWLKFSNISPRRFYEWAYYPSQQFFLMAGFTYSL